MEYAVCEGRNLSGFRGVAFEEVDDAFPPQVSGDIEYHVVRAVPSAYKAQCIGRGVFAQPFAASQNVAPEGAAFEEHGLEIVEYQFRGGILVTLYFIADNLHFLVDFRLGIDTVEHQVGKNVHSIGEEIAEDGGIIYRFLLVGEGVEVASEAFQAVVDVETSPAFGAFESHVFDKMSHAGVGRLFVAGTGLDDVAAVDHVGLSGFEDDAQAVLQSKGGHFRKWNSEKVVR